MICHLREFMYQQCLYVFICSLFHPFMLSIKSSRTCIKKKKVSDRYVLSFVLVHLDKIHLMFKFHFCYLQRNKIHETETCIWICSIFLVKNRNNGNWNAKISQLEYLPNFYNVIIGAIWSHLRCKIPVYFLFCFYPCIKTLHVRLPF